MDFNTVKRHLPEDIIVHIEEYNRIDNIVIFDFYDSNENRTFCELLNIEFNYGPSLVVIQDYQGKKVMENTFYRISKDVINRWLINESVHLENNSFIIGYTIKNNAFNVFSESITFNLGPSFYYSNFLWYESSAPEIKLLKEKGKARILIKNVGQANWNEIQFNNIPRIVYDCGAPTFASKSEVREIIGNKTAEYLAAKPILILSHWDKDHYHALCGMSDEELSAFKAVIYRKFNYTFTSRILLGRFQRLINEEISLPPEEKVKGKVRLIRKSNVNNQIVIYNATKHKDRNVSGIVITMKTARSSAVLCGDAHYEQISDDVLPDLNYKNNHYLIVPHHGGQAGHFKYQIGKKLIPTQAIISVGKNHYNHPTYENIQSLKSLKFNLQRTDFDGDIIIDL